MSSTALLVLRLAAGLGLAVHGYQKVISGTDFSEWPWQFEAMNGFAGWLDSLGVPLPHLAAWIAKLSELVGGVCVALGFFTRPAAFFAAVTMAIAILVAHLGDPFGDWELAALYFAAMTAIMFSGPGEYSLDAKRRD
jgi:putative oxidoreductase